MEAVMGKLKLDLESVQVESFEVSPERMGTSTVKGYAMDAAGPSDYASCPTAGCGTCYETCWNTCEASCPGTSGATEPAKTAVGIEFEGY
jgi:hypothetical protein